MPDETINTDLAKLRIDKARKRRRRGGAWGWLLLLAVAGAAAGYWHLKAHAAVPVRVARAERVGGGASSAAGAAVLTASGYVIPRHSVEVSSKIIGRVKEMNVSRGDRVQAGDVLIRIEDDEQQAQLRVAEAQRAAANARLAEMRAGSRPQEIQAARAAVASAQATLENARAALDRLEKLGQASVVSRQELDQVRAASKVAKAGLDSARENLKLIETWPRREQLDAAVAQQREAEANVAYARTQLDNTVIRAPIGGTILEKVAEKGELVTNINFGGERGAKSAIVTMADLKDLQVELDVNENDLPKVRLHQPCEVRADSAPDRTFKGEVDEIAPQADRQKGTVQVKARLIDPSDAVLPEVNARVTFLETASAAADPSAGAASRVFIPRQALVNGAAGKLVYIAADGVAVERAVKVGGDGPRGVEILDGLTGNELLITEPLDKIKDGTRVAVQS